MTIDFFPQKRLCVLGLGYIGLPTAAMFATHGWHVTGVDSKASVVETLQSGGLHIQEHGLRELVHTAISSGNLQVSREAVPADAFIIAVPTPFYADKRADMRAVTAATQAIAGVLQPGNLVVLESTSPPRTTVDLVQPILEQSGLRAGVDFHLAYSPERVLPGRILVELVENARVIGGVTGQSAETGRALYAAFVKGEIVLTDATTAEMVKLMENTYRDVNIAIANEFGRLAERFGVDVWEAISLANRHPRVKILQPGPGVGGHCISVDPWFLVEAAPDLAQLIRQARQVNDDQPALVTGRIRELLGGDLAGKRIAALGLSYKPDVDDLRESPAVEIAHLLSAAGAQVIAFEPNKPDAVFEGFRCVDTIETALAGADLIVILVGHRVFRDLVPARVAQISAARQVVDTVNLTNADWQKAGFQVTRLGVGK